MGKKTKFAGCNNPIAMARASGPAPVSGPTIRDYLSRDRPTLEEATDKIMSTQKKKESGALAAWEEEQNDRYKEELKRQREQRLGTGASSSRSERKKKKKRKSKRSRRRERSRSRSRSPLSSDSESDDESYRKRRKKSRKKRKHSKRKRRHYHSSSSDDSESESEIVVDHLPPNDETPVIDTREQTSSTLDGD